MAVLLRDLRGLSRAISAVKAFFLENPRNHRRHSPRVVSKLLAESNSQELLFAGYSDDRGYYNDRNGHEPELDSTFFSNLSVRVIYTLAAQRLAFADESA